MTSFDGRSFEFFGKVGAYYNVISEKQHQVTHHRYPFICLQGVLQNAIRCDRVSVPRFQRAKMTGHNLLSVPLPNWPLLGFKTI